MSTTSAACRPPSACAADRDCAGRPAAVQGLSVEDNLRVGGLVHKARLFKADREYVLSLFPRLRERLGSLAANLSGGEQQMLSIGRALMARPKLIMIDELSLGLMPKMVDLCYDALLRLKQTA